MHEAATPPHVLLFVRAVCTGIDGNTITFDVTAVDDEGTTAAQGTVTSAVVNTSRFRRGVRAKAERVGVTVARQLGDCDIRRAGICPAH